VIRLRTRFNCSWPTALVFVQILDLKNNN
jgi:hypothetical protein